MNRRGDLSAVEVTLPDVQFLRSVHHLNEGQTIVINAGLFGRSVGSRSEGFPDYHLMVDINK